MSSSFAIQIHPFVEEVFMAMVKIAECLPISSVHISSS